MCYRIFIVKSCLHQVASSFTNHVCRFKEAASDQFLSGLATVILKKSGETLCYIWQGWSGIHSHSEQCFVRDLESVCQRLCCVLTANPLCKKGNAPCPNPSVCKGTACNSGSALQGWTRLQCLTGPFTSDRRWERKNNLKAKTRNNLAIHGDKCDMSECGYNTHLKESKSELVGVDTWSLFLALGLCFLCATSFHLVKSRPKLLAHLTFDACAFFVALLQQYFLHEHYN